MKSRRSNWLLTVVIVGGVGLFSYHRSDLPLLARARRITTLLMLDEYVWKSDREALIGRMDRPPILQLSTLDTKTGVEQHRKGSVDPLASQGLNLGALSHDGKWVLVESHDVGTPTQHVTAVPIDGTNRPLQFNTFEQRTAVSDPAWFPRDNRWVALFNRNGGIEAIVGNTITPKKRKTIPLGRLEGRDRSPLKLSIIGWRNRGNSLLALDDRTSESSTVRLIEFDPTKEGDSGREHMVTLPNGAHLTEVALSADGERLAWTCRYAKSTSWIMVQLSNIIPSVRSTRFALYTSRVGNPEFNEVGSVAVEGPSLMHLYPMSLRWNPRGKEVGLKLEDALWSIPVE
jgi:hypothetical protein